MRGEVFLEMRGLVSDVILLAKSTTKVWQADYFLKFIEARQRKLELEIQTSASNDQYVELGTLEQEA
jgi:hypothetical protein